jgi:cysteine sulfinate desulfinase/cysteine desulfurase-like protein
MAAVRPSTVMVTLMLANNETGVIFDIASVAR